MPLDPEPPTPRPEIIIARRALPVLTVQRSAEQVAAALTPVRDAYRRAPAAHGRPDECVVTPEHAWQGDLLRAIAPALHCGTLGRETLRVGGDRHDLEMVLAFHEVLVPRAEYIIGYAITHEPATVEETIRQRRRAELARAGDVARPATHRARLNAPSTQAERAAVRAAWLHGFAAYVRHHLIRV